MNTWHLTTECQLPLCIIWVIPYQINTKNPYPHKILAHEILGENWFLLLSVEMLSHSEFQHCTTFLELEGERWSGLID